MCLAVKRQMHGRASKRVVNACRWSAPIEGCAEKNVLMLKSAVVKMVCCVPSRAAFVVWCDICERRPSVPRCVFETQDWDWQNLGDSLFRKWKLYDLTWYASVVSSARCRCWRSLPRLSRACFPCPCLHGVLQE